MNIVNRKFSDAPAVRERTPLLIGLVGPSGSGKTFSALRLATGITRVSGGKIYLIDTEKNRSKQYAGAPYNFNFQHVPFEAPFGSLHYLAAIEYCYQKTPPPGVIIVDSMSHEHEGPGGHLEAHEAEVQRLSKGRSEKVDAVKMLAWSQPKAERRRLINTLLQMQMNFIFCFRAKEKMKIIPGSQPEPLGFQPIAGEEFVYEMTVNCLLYPNSNGIPTQPSETKLVGERMVIKTPAQFRALFAKPMPLSEDIGETMARWAEGSKSGPFEAMAQRIANAGSLTDLEALRGELNEMREKKAIPAAELKALRESYQDRLKALQDYARDESATYDEEGDPPPPDDAEGYQQQQAVELT